MSIPQSSNPLLLLLPWCVFALAAGLKFWQFSRWLRPARSLPSSDTERFRARLERIWQREQPAA